MKKLLLLVAIFLLAGCQEVNDLIRIQKANKEITEIQIEMEVESDAEVDVDITEEIGFDVGLQLGLDVTMEVSNGVIHSYSTINVFGFGITMEQYSQSENGQRVVYTNFFDIWTKEVAEESELMNLYFDAGEFLKAMNGSFKIIDPITVNEEELKQMRITMTIEDVENIFGLDYTTPNMTEEEVTEMLAKEITVILGYTDETYLIERVELDLINLFDDMPEETHFTSFSMIFTFSRHNEIGDIILPPEVLMTPFSKD